jgi:prolyl-tRNA synthetase
MDGHIGVKSESEKFAGAKDSISFESLMPDGKALQSCTSHDLGQNFSKVFNIKFQDVDGESKYVWQTSWGFSTRSIGALILAHGDDNGLRLPPNVAPYQVVIIPVGDNANVISRCRVLLQELKDKDIRVILDDRDDETLGYKINKWELKGVPVRLEVGEKEISDNNITAVRRDNGVKGKIPLHDIVESIKNLLKNIQEDMLSESEKFLSDNTFSVDKFDELKKIMSGGRGFIKSHWCESPECEAKIKEETKATTRCKLLDEKEEPGKCVYCGKKSNYRWIFGQSY